MNRSATLIVFIGLVVSLTSLAHGLNYVYFTDTEVTANGLRGTIFGGDSLTGPLRSNDTIHVMGSPSFGDFVITTAPDFWRGPGYNPNLDSAHLIFNAPRLLFPDSIAWVRQSATQSGYFYDTGNNVQTWGRLSDHHIRFWTAPLGQPIDSNVFVDWPLPDSAVVFVNGPLNLWGTVGSVLILGAAGRIGLEDNIIYASSDPVYGLVSPGHAEKLALVSEDEIKILNTVANGRENSGGAGVFQTDQSLTSIALNGVFVALGQSFTFDQQNDPDSGYVCECQPDDRGTVYLSGSILQKQRGYTHRSSRSSTGYLKQYRADPDLKFWELRIFNARENAIGPTALVFPTTSPGAIARDTIRVSNDFVPIKLDSLRISAPFHAAAPVDSFMWTQALPVEFTPTGPGLFCDTLHFYNPYYHQWFAVPVTGTCGITGVDESSILHPSSFILSASPNPFNPSTTIRFEIPAPGAVTLSIYDLLGRESASLLNSRLESGSHSAVWDASRQPSGIYFARLECAAGVRVEKLLLTK